MGRRDDEFSECAVLPIIFAGDTEHAAVVAEVDFTAPAEFAMAAVNCGVERDAIAGGPALDGAANLRDDAAGFVAHDDRRAAAASAAVHAVDVAAANAAGFYGDKDFVGSWRWGGDVFAGEFFVLFKDEGLHGRVFSIQFSVFSIW